MDETKLQFVAAYGNAVKTVSDVVLFVVGKEFLGADLKFGLEDIGLIVAKLIPVITSVDSFKTLVESPALFLDSELKPELQKAFADNFNLMNESTEMMVEEIHDIVLSIIKIVVKLKAAAAPVAPVAA